MDESWVLLDASSGLHQAWYFWLRVLDEVNRSTRYGAPFALLLLEAVSAENAPRLLDEANSYVPATIRSTDLGGAMGIGRSAVLLTHQDATAAALARDRILDRLERSCPSELTWRPNLLCYPECAAEISDLLTSGWRDRDREGTEGREAQRSA